MREHALAEFVCPILLHCSHSAFDRGTVDEATACYCSIVYDYTLHTFKVLFIVSGLCKRNEAVFFSGGFCWCLQMQISVIRSKTEFFHCGFCLCFLKFTSTLPKKKKRKKKTLPNSKGLLSWTKLVEVFCFPFPFLNNKKSVG